MASLDSTVPASPNSPLQVIWRRFLRWRARYFALEDVLQLALIVLVHVWLIAFVLLPLVTLIDRSMENKKGEYVGFANYEEYLRTPSLSRSFENSLNIAVRATIITVALAFVFAYALTRTRMPFKPFFRLLAMLPIFAPSLLHGIAFVYLFGRQGIVTRGYFGYFEEHYGFDPSYDLELYLKPTGIILAEVFYLFPHAMLILLIALSVADARLYEAATALKTNPVRTFFTVTLPSVRYGLISAVFVCFTLAFTDFGIPKVIGGNGADVLAIDIYQNVTGLFNFSMGATVSVLLLTPTVIAFIIDRLAQRRQTALLTSRAVPLQPKRQWVLDTVMFLYCTVVVLAIVAVIGTALFASLAERWPYKRDLTLDHYDFTDVAGGYGSGKDSSGLAPFYNSLRMAGLTALVGTIIVFVSAYLIEKGRGMKQWRSRLYFLSTLPVALPGTVLGLSYIFFFNDPDNPLNSLYNTMTILVISTVIHFYTVSFLTATTALKQIDGEFESVSRSLNVPFYLMFFRVTVPVSLPAILEIAIYFFVNAMTTVSAVIFLYAPDLKLASVAVVNMDDAGDTQPAAAMSMMIFFASLGVWLAYSMMTLGIRRATQAWRKR